ncbi:ADP-ribose glycohydrolase MACROD1 isoform X2 [Rhinatrema bivittatum]|uniref:ADP-ribose glycohydrolase MACROD1 isoform X2 n=1 Tax=Rhinatrema bivittatum TaxID=194408 RepID=UPI00112AD108|nr:ADP-ribose glycohydrolase MACROD1 isoform X2 [Rhinatrema bivittatum]
MGAGILARAAVGLRVLSTRSPGPVRLDPRRARAAASGSGCAAARFPPLLLATRRLLFYQPPVTLALAAPRRTFAAMATKSSGKPDLSSDSGSWKEAKSFLKGLNSKQRREHYGTKDYVKLKEIHAWKETAKSAKLKQPEEVKYQKDKDLNEKISLFRGDITKLEVDAIVNAANSTLLGGGGVDGCIHRAAGPLLRQECSTLNGCETGKAKITCGYSLPARFVIHTVGPIAKGDPSERQVMDLTNCYKNSLNLVLENKIHTVAFPCISTGVYGYPGDAAADVALNTIRLWLQENKEKVDRIIVCVFLEKDEEIYKKKLLEYFPIA